MSPRPVSPLERLGQRGRPDVCMRVGQQHPVSAPRAQRRRWPRAPVWASVLLAAQAVVVLLATAFAGMRRPALAPATDSHPTLAVELPPVVHVLEALRLLEFEERSARNRRACQNPEAHNLLKGPIGVDVIRVAQGHLDLPMGSARSVSIKSKRYLFCLEPHYRPPGTGHAPYGWHKGVTVYLVS